MVSKLLLWLVLIALVSRSLSRFVKGLLEGAGYQRVNAGPPGVALVRDPICGMFVVPAKALRAGEGRDALYFCSEKCRREWLVRGRGKAVS